MVQRLIDDYFGLIICFFALKESDMDYLIGMILSSY